MYTSAVHWTHSGNPGFLFTRSFDVHNGNELSIRRNLRIPVWLLVPVSLRLPPARSSGVRVFFRCLFYERVPFFPWHRPARTPPSRINNLIYRESSSRGIAHRCSVLVRWFQPPQPEQRFQSKMESEDCKQGFGEGLVLRSCCSPSVHPAAPTYSPVMQDRRSTFLSSSPCSPGSRLSIECFAFNLRTVLWVRSLQTVLRLATPWSTLSATSVEFSRRGFPEGFPK